MDNEEVRSLKEQIRKKRENLLLLQERKAEYMNSVDIPLQYIKRERELNAELEELRNRLAQIEQQAQQAWQRPTPQRTPPKTIPRQQRRPSPSANTSRVKTITVLIFTGIILLIILWSSWGGGEKDGELGQPQVQTTQPAITRSPGSSPNECGGFPVSPTLQCLTIYAGRTETAFDSEIVLSLLDKGTPKSDEIQVDISSTLGRAEDSGKVVKTGSCFIAEPFAVRVNVTDPAPIIGFGGGNRQQADFLIRKMTQDFDRNACKVIYLENP